jgi:hypothetical protein
VRQILRQKLSHSVPQEIPRLQGSATACHQYLSWARWVQFTTFFSISIISILILSSQPCLGIQSCLSRSVFKQEVCMHLPSLHACYIPRLLHSPWFNYLMKSTIYGSPPPLCAVFSSLLSLYSSLDETFFSEPCSQISIRVLPLMWDVPSFTPIQNKSAVYVRYHHCFLSLWCTVFQLSQPTTDGLEIWRDSLECVVGAQ